MRLSRICVWACPANFLAKILLVIRPVWSPGSGARRDVRGAPRQKNRRSGWFRRPSHSSPTVTFPMGNQSDPPGTKGCAHMPVGLDREEGGFGRFTARRSMHPVCIARARAASCRTWPRGSVNRPVGHLFRGRRRSVRPRPALWRPRGVLGGRDGLLETFFPAKNDGRLTQWQSATNRGKAQSNQPRI